MPRLPERAAPICQSKHLGLAVKPGWDLCSCLGAEQGRVGLLVGGPACIRARVPPGQASRRALLQLAHSHSRPLLAPQQLARRRPGPRALAECRRGQHHQHGLL